MKGAWKRTFTEGAHAWARGEITKRLQASIAEAVTEVLTAELLDDWFLEDEVIGKEYAAVEAMVLEDMELFLDLDETGAPVLVLMYGEAVGLSTQREIKTKRFTPDDLFQIDGKGIRGEGRLTREDVAIARQTLDAVRAWKAELDKLEAEIIAAGGGS